MRLNFERSHFHIGDTFSCFIAAAFEIRSYLQSRGGLGTFDVLDYSIERTQWHTGPIQADMAKQPVFNWIPFRASWRVMAYRNRESAGVTQLLQLCLPDT